MPFLRMLLFVLLGTVLSGCTPCGCSAAAEPSRRDALLFIGLFGRGYVAPSGHHIFLRGDGGYYAAWLCEKKHFQTNALPGQSIKSIAGLPGDDLILARVMKTRPPSHGAEEFLLIDPTTLAVQKSYPAPAGPAQLLCRLNPTTVVGAQWASQVGETWSYETVVWRMEGASLTELRTLGEDYGSGCVGLERVSNDLVLILERPNAKRLTAHRVGVYNATTGRRVADVRVRGVKVYLKAASTNGKFCAVLVDNRVELRSLPSLELLHQSPEVSHDETAGAFAISPCGQFIALGGARVRVWDTSRKEIRTIDPLHQPRVRSSGLDFPFDPASYALDAAVAYNQCDVNTLAFTGDTTLTVLTCDGYCLDCDAKKAIRLSKTRIAPVAYIAPIKKDKDGPAKPSAVAVPTEGK